MNKSNLSPQDVTSLDYRLRDTRIFIVAHHDFSIDGLHSILASHGHGLQVTSAEPGDACMSRLVTARPEVLMIQNQALSDPPEHFLQAIAEYYPDMRILVFGKNMEDERLYRLVRAGAHGYINERMDGKHLLQALDNLIDGRTWIERHIMERFIATQRETRDIVESQFYSNIEALCGDLTRREIEILCQVMQGLAIKQIAERVHLSHQGVKMHLAKLFRKFGVTDRHQLILAAFDRISPVEDLGRLLKNGLSGRLQQRQA